MKYDSSWWFLEHIWPDANGNRLCVAASVGGSVSKLVLGACQPWPAHLWYQEPPG
ncbi:hypothetical protein GCM10010168_21080 [Actinoplanes ianthinogenes]|uniref:Ricin B lectin domain-containing protein n=1 Tax=Actinoplanes ianthinogenes TaxID=122358 RepID=A0ABM7M7V9_9ACTN|nr:hypothetical protein [Actinoplanes ianthinogenes]BCJ47749.1 hypothetical protein Aiant_84060 [Actinoplanes ianthinogenes]GGR03908.1 hypothetical protein GCM10010168_21080 [Actinoplanes ianthinogenes]